MSEESIRVLIADDHRLICEGLQLVLTRARQQVVGVAYSGRQVVEMVDELNPDVVILDVRMPDMDGLQALGAIKSSRPETSVIMLTAYSYPEYLARAIMLGAAGFISKDDDPDTVPNAVRAVMAGEAILDLELLQQAMNALSEITHTIPFGSERDRPSLTPQEMKVLTLISEGLDNQAIAVILSVSMNTVKTHIRNIFSKVGVSDRTQAAMWAVRNGLVS